MFRDGFLFMPALRASTQEIFTAESETVGTVPYVVYQVRKSTWWVELQKTMDGHLSKLTSPEHWFRVWCKVNRPTQKLDVKFFEILKSHS